jgi:hypothetical protein
VNFSLDNRIHHADVKEARHAHHWLDLISRPASPHHHGYVSGDTPCVPPDGHEVAGLRIEARLALRILCGPGMRRACRDDCRCRSGLMRLAPAGRAADSAAVVTHMHTFLAVGRGDISGMTAWRHSRYGRALFTQPSADSVACTRPGQTAGFTGSTSATQTRPRPSLFGISGSLPPLRGSLRPANLSIASQCSELG